MDTAFLSVKILSFLLKTGQRGEHTFKLAPQEVIHAFDTAVDSIENSNSIWP